jgi:hypothetical protein
MPIKITWDDGVAKPTVFNMPDEVVNSVEQYRLTLTQLNPDTMRMDPIYPTVQALIVGVFMQQVVMQALSRFPTAAVATAKAARDKADEDLMAAQAAAVPGLVQEP